MFKRDRDREIVLSIGKFKQLSPEHLRTMHFSSNASDTPMYRALDRLKSMGYIKPIAPRMIGGNGQGSGPTVWQLGRAGWAVCGREGKYWPIRAIDYHTLAIADAYREFLKLEQRGLFKIDRYSTEPDSHIEVEGITLRPDLFIDIEDSLRSQYMGFWLEIDMGTERTHQITVKLEEYAEAARRSETKPIVVFIVPDERRARWLRAIIEGGSEEDQRIFLVSTMSEFAPLIFS